MYLNREIQDETAYQNQKVIDDGSELVQVLQTIIKQLKTGNLPLDPEFHGWYTEIYNALHTNSDDDYTETVDRIITQLDDFLN